MVVTLAPEGLRAAGSQLAGSAQSFAPAAAAAPGADPTSVSAAGQLSAASQALSLLLEHSGALREVGGAAVAGTAAMLTGQDSDNAALIVNGGGSGAPSAPASVPQVPSPSVPSIPQLPAAPAPMPGEMFSQALYNGPGSAGVHQFADQWVSHGQQLGELQSSLTRTAQSIDEHWIDGTQQAGANVTRHADWVGEMAQHAHNLAGNARSVGDAYDQAKAATPSPQEFAETRQQLQQAQQRFAATCGANAAEVQQLMQQYATQQAQATDAATGYHGQISAATFSAGGAKTAPPIVGGGDGSATPMSKRWKQGDKRHDPVVVGPGNLGPPNTWGGEPPWLEIGTGSGNFVRSDEIPGVKVLAPGELGPATVSDTHGNLDPYIELGPNTGVWVPQSDFPGAKFYAPDSPQLPPAGWQEYLPHSGIFIWHGDLTPEPYPWNGGGSPVTHPAG